MASHPKFSLRQQAAVRDHINAVKLVNFLQDHAVSGRRKKPIDKSRVVAALGLLKKVLPDLNHTAISDPNGGPVQTVGIVTNDPAEAAKAYQDIIKGA